jgi:hypothetical protein
VHDDGVRSQATPAARHYEGHRDVVPSFLLRDWAIDPWMRSVDAEDLADERLIGTINVGPRLGRSGRLRRRKATASCLSIRTRGQ